jgi:hypothetical protein
MEDENDVVPIGRLRRIGQPGASVTYDPGHGIRVETEDVPPTPAAAAAWIRSTGGWLRVYGAVKKTKRLPIAEFLKAVKAR